MTVPVSTVSALRRRCGASTQIPVAGAKSATDSPAIVSTLPSQLAGVVSPGRPAPTCWVR